MSIDGQFSASLATSRMEVERPFERVALDYLGPIEPPSVNGNRYLLVAMEYFTRWPISKAVKNTNAENTVDFVYEQVICQSGPPKYIMTDVGRHFDNHF